MIIPERVFQTLDGRYVFEDDPEARFLAYIKGEDVGDLAASQLGLDKLINSHNKRRKQEATQ